MPIVFGIQGRARCDEEQRDVIPVDEANKLARYYQAMGRMAEIEAEVDAHWKRFPYKTLSRLRSKR